MFYVWGRRTAIASFAEEMQTKEKVLNWRQNIQHGDIQYNDTQHL